MTLRVAVTGASGRMGQAVARAVIDDADTHLVGLVAREGSPLVGAKASLLLGAEATDVIISDTLSPIGVDVVIDFTLPDATLANAAVCAEAGVPMVIGTTGFSGESLLKLQTSLKPIASCHAANFSTGVNLAYRLLELAARVIGSDADIEIHEAHHKRKLDAPSGTALAMGESIANALGATLDDIARYERSVPSALSEAREPGSIGFSVTRAGDIVGDHTVLFASEGERIEITHKASSRSAFALGALRAAKFVVAQPAGAYSMADVLGLSH